MSKRKPVMKPLHLEVFKTYCAGGTLADAAAAHDQSLRMVQKWSAKYGWSELKNEVYANQYQVSMSRMKGTLAAGLAVIDKAIRTKLKDVNEGKSLTKDDLDFVLKTVDRLAKEVRLEDDKPTDNHGGPQQVTLVINGGEANRNLFPPSMGGAKVIDVDSEEVAELPTVPEGMEDT